MSVVGDSRRPLRAARVLCVVVLASGWPGARVCADAPSVTAMVRTGVATNYVWRGDPLFAPMLAPISLTILQLGVSALGPGTLYAGYWNGTQLADGVTWPFPYAGYTVAMDLLAIDLQYGVFLHSHLQPVDQQHNFQIAISYDVGPYLGWRDAHLRPRVMASTDPIRVLGAYAQIGCEALASSGDVTVRVDVYTGVSAYRGLPFDAQDLSLELGITEALGDGFAGGLDLTVAHAFRAGTQRAAVGVFVTWSR